MSDYIHTYSNKEQERLFRQGKILENIVFNFFDLSPFKNIIELGCGNGGNTKILLNKNITANITAVDISEQQIKDAKANLERSDRLTFEQGDICDLKYKDNTFDCAFICWVLEHLEDPQKAVNEAYRILQAGGQLLITEVFNRSLYLYPDHFPAIDEYFSIFNDLQTAMKGHPDIGVQMGNLLYNAGFKNINLKNNAILFDKRNIRQRNEMIDYYIELILSAKDILLEKKLIDNSLILAVSEEKEKFKEEDNSIFYYAPFQSIAVK